MLYCPNLSEKQKPCTVPIFELETLKRFFGFFGTVQRFCFSEPKRLGRYSVFACLDPKTLGQYSIFACMDPKTLDSAAFSAPGELEVLYCPNLFGTQTQKHCTVPVFELETLKRLFFLGGGGQYSVFTRLRLKDWDSTAFLQFLFALGGP